MKVLTSGKLFTFRGLTYQVKKAPGHGSLSCQHCEENCSILCDMALCTFCSEHLELGYYPSRIHKKDDNMMQFRIKSAIDSIKTKETNEVIGRLKCFGHFEDNGKTPEYSYVFKKPIPVTIRNYHSNCYTKVKEVTYRPASKGGPIYTVGLYSKYNKRELIGETIITEHIGEFFPGDVIKIALAIK